MLFKDAREEKKRKMGTGDLISDRLGRQYLIIFDFVTDKQIKLLGLETMVIEAKYNSLMAIEQEYVLIASHEELLLIADN